MRNELDKVHDHFTDYMQKLTVVYLEETENALTAKNVERAREMHQALDTLIKVREKFHEVVKEILNERGVK